MHTSGVTPSRSTADLFRVLAGFVGFCESPKLQDYENFSQVKCRWSKNERALRWGVGVSRIPQDRGLR